MKTTLLLALSIALVGCGPIRGLPQDRTTLTLPGSTTTCVNGHKATPTGGTESLGYAPAVVISNDRCVAKK